MSATLIPEYIIVFTGSVVIWLFLDLSSCILGTQTALSQCNGKPTCAYYGQLNILISLPVTNNVLIKTVKYT